MLSHLDEPVALACSALPNKNELPEAAPEPPKKELAPLDSAIAGDTK